MTEVDLTESRFNIGKASAQAGVFAKTVRHSEAVAPMPKVVRTAMGGRH